MALGDLKISGDGRRGDDGKDGTGSEGHAREHGVNGKHGEHATSPTDGAGAQTVHVFLKRSPNSSAGQLIVTVDRHDDQCSERLPHSNLMEEFSHELGGSGTILISACGGAGGRGGCGGSGQGGGHGKNGENATLEVSGRDGGPGGKGGNAGDGTSGANGGRAGEIKLFIKEQEMDLLAAMEPLGVQGGRGGKAGTCGAPGPGGNGGRAGASYTWKEITKNEGVTKEITRQNVAGKAGPGGKAGEPSEAKPVNGTDGADGYANIFIQKPDGNFDGPFPSAYKLEVVEFEVVDGNEDGILEFGEDIVLRNIRVRNSGGTPSPSSAQVTMDGDSTDWLIAPRTTHLLPKSIISGSTVRLDGRFTFRAKRPDDIPVGRPFEVEDAFKLRGHMSGIDRVIRGFHQPKTIKLQYPVEMTKPKYLRCLTLGQEAVFSWKVENKSTKDLGADSASTRQIKFTIKQTGPPSLTFGPSKADTYVLPVSLLPARGSGDVEVLVKVPLKAEPYTKTQARISLELARPDNSGSSAIQTYDIPIQLSNAFSYDPEAKFLLVTNFETTGNEVDRWHHLISTRFGMKMDVWNVSVNGHLELLSGSTNAERQSMFHLYKGKTIIMLGNSFPYFERGQRTAMDLIDSKECAASAFDGTNLFISALDVNQTQPLHLTRLLRTSTYSINREFDTVQQLVKAILLERREKTFYNTVFVCCPKSRGNNATRCSGKATRAARELLRHLPHLRFIVSWTTAEALDTGVTGAGRIEIRPCIPFDHSKFILTRPVSASRSDEMNEIAILLSLPFATKLTMLWKEFSDDRASGKQPTPRGVAEIVVLDLVTELARLVNPAPPWPDTIQKADILTYLPRLEAFLKHDSDRPFSQTCLEQVVQIVGDLTLLANCCPGSMPRQVTFSTRRKNIWTELVERISIFLQLHFGHLGKKVASAPYTKYVNEQVARTKLDSPESRKDNIIKRVTDKVPIYIGMDFGNATTGLVDLAIMGNIVINQTEVAAWKQLDFSSSTQLKEDLTHAKEEVEADMSRLPGYTA